MEKITAREEPPKTGCPKSQIRLFEARAWVADAIRKVHVEAYTEKGAIHEAYAYFTERYGDYDLCDLNVWEINN